MNHWLALWITCIVQFFIPVLVIRLFQVSGISHNVPHLSPPPPPQILYIPCFSFLLGILRPSQDKLKTMLMRKFWGANKVHYGKCGSGVLFTFACCIQKKKTALCAWADLTPLTSTGFARFHVNIACTDSYQALRSKGRRENKTSQEKITRARSREGGHHFLLLDWNELMWTERK